MPSDGAWQAAARPDGVVVTPETALGWLLQGNARWAAGAVESRDHGPEVPATDGQWPFAAVLACSDSRVVPELVFDVAPGNLFTVRNAGNIVDDDVLGSLEFSVSRLGVPAIVVLGHTQCGAVRAAESALDSGLEPGGHVASILEHIMVAESALPPEHTERAAIEANVKQSARLLAAQSSGIDAATADGRVGIVAALYDLGSRQVHVLH